MSKFIINNLEYDGNELEIVHGTPEESFMPIVQRVFPHAEFLETPDGRQLIYVNNNSPMLFAVHLDGTMPASHFAMGRHYQQPNDTCIFSPYVDDRLGAYVALHLLPQLGIIPDMTFSVGEEQGNPTSRFYTTDKIYNWIFQFDRKGSDVVHYQYTEASWLTGLTKHFLEISHGSFSDISAMGHLGVCGVNVGTGYHDYTGPGAWASLDELTEQVYRFAAFWEEFKDTRFPFITPIYVNQRKCRRRSLRRGKYRLKINDQRKK